MAEERELAVGRRVQETTPAIDSASVVLVRDGECGLELFMLERHIETDFAGGALVFPGGKVEDGDRELAADRWSGVDPGGLTTMLGTESAEGALGLLVAAVRETFEEAGILLADHPTGPVDDDMLARPSFVTARQRLTDRAATWDWRDWLADEGLVLRLDRLAFFSWWVTPHGVHRRYDTRFFVARVPAAQAAALAHDEIETTASRWLRPAEALSLGRQRQATVVFPTRKNLEVLATYAHADELVDAAAEGGTDRRRLRPRLVDVDGRTMVQHPDGGPPEAG